MSLSSARAVGRQPRKWTMAEDQKLREQVEAQMSEGEVKDWCRIAAKLPGRTNKDCRKRWHNSVAGGLKKGQWSKSEDVQLARGVQQYGQRWTLVANIVGSRSADQCAKRWQQSLDPDLDRSEWCDVEDKVLIEAVQKLGRHWKDIQRHHFAGRSKNCIKNRYTVLVRRYQNQGITLPPPAASPEPNASHSTTDDDDMSYTSSLQDEFQNSHTQVSTPETHHSWPVDVEHYSGWTSQDSFNNIAAAASLTHAQQPQIVNATHSPPWNWTTTSMSQPTMMHMTPHCSFLNVSDAAALVAYDAYGGVSAMLSPNPTRLPGNYVRGPTSSPIPRATTASPYQDPQAMSHYLRYGMQREPPFPY